MRVLLFLAGALLSALGFLAFRAHPDHLLLQGGLTLGGGFVICGIFSIRSKWHGIAGGGILAFLGTLRALPAAVTGRTDPAAPFLFAAGAICLVVMIGAIAALRAERARRSLDSLKAGE